MAPLIYDPVCFPFQSLFNNSMKINNSLFVDVEYDKRKTTQVQLKKTVLARISDDPGLALKLKDTFQLDCRVPDVWRYSFWVQKGTVVGYLESPAGPRLPYSNFEDVDSNFAIEEKVILLILESPHVEEYFLDKGRLTPRGPAQGTQLGDAGGALREYGCEILSQLNLPTGKYALVIGNPVSYHASLSWMQALLGLGVGPQNKLDAVVRNHVWKQFWSLDVIKDDFLKRCKNLKPVRILNCCTKILKPHVTCVLCKHGFNNVLFQASHPAYTWNVGYGKDGKRKGVAVTAVNCTQCKTGSHK